jgi:tetratricopeptide (TPR) repeat protein
MWEVAGATGMLFAITAVCVARMRRNPYLMVGWFWFLGTMVPVIGLVSIGANYRADRYTYVSTVGLSMALVWLAREFYNRVSWPSKQAVFGGAGVALVLVFAALCWRQVGFWSDNVVLLSRTLQWDKDHVQTRYNLATAYYDRGDFDKALEHYTIVAEHDAQVGDVLFRLGATLYNLGQYPQAEANYRAGMEFNDTSPEAWVGLGMSQAKLGRPADAAQSFNHALELRPEYPMAQSQLKALQSIH